MTARLATPRPFPEDDDGLAAAVIKALSDCGLSVPATGSTDWQLSIAGRRGSARVDDGWLVLEFPPPRGRAPSLFRLLGRNVELRGNAKHVLLADGSLRLRAEVPVEETLGRGAAGVAEQVREAVAGLASALGAPSSGTSSPGEVTADGGAEDGAPSSDPGTLCAEADWPHSERSSGRVHVDLDVPGGTFYQAVVGLVAGRIVQRVELFAEGGTGTESLASLAIAALLLSTSGVVRMARAASWNSDLGAAWGFEVQLPGTTTVGAFGHGLSALSVACGLCGREVRALACDPALARRYIELRHRRLMPKQRELLRHLSAANAAAS
jgi:hypothetical protein